MQNYFKHNNSFHLQGRISALNEYAPGKACNISLAITTDTGNENGNTAIYIQTKSFSPAIYNTLSKGMLVGIYGHIVPNKYVNKQGQNVYALDLVADFVDFLEAKSTVEQRTVTKQRLAARNEAARLEEKEY